MDYFSILKSSPLPKNEIEILLAFLLNKNREFLITHPEIKLDKKSYIKFKNLEKKRLDNWSIATLIGEKEFYGLGFKVDKNVLVPRPESELIVDEVLDILKKETNKFEIIDLGTGSGAIIISLAAQLEKTDKSKYNNTTFKAIDISKLALKIAKKNSLLNEQGPKIKFYLGNLLEPLINKRDYIELISSKILITANLPYLTPRQVKSSPSIQKEPRIALVAGKDGLECYRVLFKQLKALDISTTVFCEIDPSQNTSIKVLIKKYFAQAKVTIKKDLAGKNRLAIITIIGK